MVEEGGRSRLKVLERFTEGPERCVYLPDRDATQTYEVVASLTDAEYETRMNAGWRKFGAFMFKPVCAACRECRPIRIPVERFAPDRSQARALKRNADLTVRYAQPSVDAARMDVYTRYHNAQAALKGWPDRERDPQDYAMQFVFNPIPSVEISVWEGDKLRAVVLTDITPNTVSGIYHYHDPDARDRSLGTFVILQTFALAARLNKPYAYLGFYVAGCGSMVYKNRFRPCEVLDADGVWRELGER